MELRESGEMYLLTIFLLKKENDYVRSVDIARHMDYSKPSVSRAIGLLHKNGYIELDEKKLISLSKKGKEIAKSLYEKHSFIRELLMNVGVSESVAEREACSIEHILSDDSFEKLKAALPEIKFNN